jgi:hypothetical protein
MIDAVDVLEQATFLNPLNSFSNSPEFYGTDSFFERTEAIVHSKPET